MTEQTRFRNTAHIHGTESGDQQVTTYGDRIDATLTLEDGRTAQVNVFNDGRVSLRAWAAQPYATDNAEAVSMFFRLPTLEDMVLDGAQVNNLNVRATGLTEQSLASPEEHDGCWYYANETIQNRVEGVRTLLALRAAQEAR